MSNTVEKDAAEREGMYWQRRGGGDGDGDQDKR